MTRSVIGMTATGSMVAVVRMEPPPCERTHPVWTVKPAWPARTARIRCAALDDDASVFRPRESAEPLCIRHHPRRGTERSSASPAGCRSVHPQGPTLMWGVWANPFALCLRSRRIPLAGADRRCQLQLDLSIHHDCIETLLPHWCRHRRHIHQRTSRHLPSTVT